MMTQKQQLLDYLAVNASEAELLGLCRTVKANKDSIEFFLKDVSLVEPKEDPVDFYELDRQQEVNEVRVLTRLTPSMTKTEILSFYAGLSLEVTRRTLGSLLSQGRVRHHAPDSWSL